MSYLVTARKWRPQTFEDVVNQEHVKHTLVNAIKTGRIAHAYLFSGPRGVGKTTVARILAKALNCEEGSTVEPCNSCTVCNEVMEGRSLDVLEIDGASNRGIDEVRNLRENIKYAPLKSAYKVYIIDEVHMLTDQAFNALLKTLEEPPKHAVFMFATTAPQKVPATILSRCQRFDFRRISTPEIKERLSLIAGVEEIPIDDEALALVARKADGSMRDSQSLMDQVVSFGDEQITVTTVRRLLGMVDQEILFQLGDLFFSKDVAATLDIAGKVIAEGVDLQEFFRGLAEHLRNLLVARAAGDTPGLIDIDDAGLARLREQAKHFSEEDLLRMIHIVSEHEFSLRKSTFPRLELEMALIRLTKLDSSVTIDDIFQRLDNLGSGTDGGLQITPREEKKEISLFDRSTPPRSDTTSVKKARSEKPIAEQPPSESKPEAQRPPVSEEDAAGIDLINQHWGTVITNVKKRKMTVGTFLSGGKPSSFKKGILTVSFPEGNGFCMEMVSKDKKTITDVLKEQFGTAMNLKCAVDPEMVPASHDQGKKDTAPRKKIDVEHLLDKEPIIRKIVTDLDGEIMQE